MFENFQALKVPFNYLVIVFLKQSHIALTAFLWAADK